MKKILLTQGQYALVDDWNYDYLMQWKWHAAWNPSTESYYAVTGGNSKRGIPKMRMSRLIAKTPRELEADHKNHDTLDNQEHNLINVTHAENIRNRFHYRLSKRNKLREKNISPDRNGFKVKIERGGKIVFRKNFKTIELAKRARDDFIEFRN